MPNTVKTIIENSTGTISDKIIDTANNKKNKETISNIIVDIIKTNPEKGAVEIYCENQKIQTVVDTIKTKNRKKEAVTTKDFDDDFDTNVSPN